ncbi:MAG: nitrilase-related carbon-nitrogen hydrolase [Arenicellales bacterium]
MSTRETVRVALWCRRLGHVAPDLARWAAAVETGVVEAAARGAEVLVMPEWIAKQWLAFAPADLAPRDEVAWLAGHSSEALELLRPLPARHGVALLSGSMPVHDRSVSPPWFNRAHLFLPDGTEIVHDKLCLTPSERDPEGWNLATGSTVRTFDLGGARAAILICLDIELPALSARLATSGIDLLLVPSYTSLLSGYSRVFGCAKARAVELLSAVCVVGCFGGLRTANGSAFESTSGAAVYIPCEPELGMNGILDALAPRPEGEGPGPILVADVPVGRIRALREGATGEVWPGAWDASRVSVS